MWTTLELEPNVSIDIKEGETMRACVHSVDVLVSVVKRHAIVDVQCVLVICVVIGVHVPLVQFTSPL